MKYYQRRNIASKIDSGFTLVELIVASTLGIFIAATAGALILDNIKWNARAEAIQRLRQDWKRATVLIDSEIALSQSSESSNLSLSTEEIQNCPLFKTNNQLRLRLRLPGNIPNVLYGVESIKNLPTKQFNQWIGGPEGGVLIRCGPQLTISQTGRVNFLEQYQQSIILDDLDLTTSKGLDADNSLGGNKMVNFKIVMKGINTGKNTNPYQFRSGSFSRINNIPTPPELQSICTLICKNVNQPCSTVPNSSVITLTSNSPRNFKDSSSTNTNATTITICTNRNVLQGDSIQGGNANYVIDANPTPIQTISHGATIKGGDSGRNILLGTASADVIDGGPFDDVLVGRGGGDELSGGKGDDNFLPWGSINDITDSSSNVTIDGGDGLDRVYINGDSTSFSGYEICQNSQCTLTSNVQKGEANLKNVEVLIFNDTSKRLN